MSERMFRVTYTGDDVHAIPKVGVFQSGTSAVVTEAVAEQIKAIPKFTVVALDGGAAPAAKASAPAAEKPVEKPAEKPPEKAEKQDKGDKKDKKDGGDKAEKAAAKDADESDASDEG
jgi:hypothetical protein